MVVLSTLFFFQSSKSSYLTDCHVLIVATEHHDSSLHVMAPTNGGLTPPGVPSNSGTGVGGNNNSMSIPSYREEGGGAMGGLSEAELGPLPNNWEKAYTERGEVYFIEYDPHPIRIPLEFIFLP